MRELIRERGSCRIRSIEFSCSRLPLSEIELRRAAGEARALEDKRGVLPPLLAAGWKEARFMGVSSDLRFRGLESSDSFFRDERLTGGWSVIVQQWKNMFQNLRGPQLTYRGRAF
eukprot:4384545-Prymnesium_polylepis.1